MDYLPLFFDLKAKPCLIVGGGSIATRKARLLKKAGACIHVVAPKVSAELRLIVKSCDGQLFEREYLSQDIHDKTVIISATDIFSVNEKVAADCNLLNLPVNVVDNPHLCSVIMPAIVDRSPLIIGITSGGEAPVLARKIRSQLESTIPAAFGQLGKLASKFRQKVKDTFPDGEIRRRFWESVLEGSVAEKVMAGRMEAAELELSEKLVSHSDHVSEYDNGGEVYLVGAGPGDPDLLTFKALRLMQRAEVVLYDRLVSAPILDMVRRDADRVYVGKQKAEHAVPQQEINQMLLRFAQQGKRVLRLKGGDPFIFGRGGEEIDLLAQHNIPFQVVPGITAASGCSSYAGIPLTHRDYSQSVRFITGHLKDGVLDFRWKEFVESQQTLVFYMGLTGLEHICARLIEHGKSATTPAALIEKGTLPDQRVHVGDLSNLPALVKANNVHAPTLLIIGEVVVLNKTLHWYK